MCAIAHACCVLKLKVQNWGLMLGSWIPHTNIYLKVFVNTNIRFYSNDRHSKKKCHRQQDCHFSKKKKKVSEWVSQQTCVYSDKHSPPNWRSFCSMSCNTEPQMVCANFYWFIALFVQNTMCCAKNLFLGPENLNKSHHEMWWSVNLFWDGQAKSPFLFFPLHERNSLKCFQMKHKYARLSFSPTKPRFSLKVAKSQSRYHRAIATDSTSYTHTCIS